MVLFPVTEDYEVPPTDYCLKLLPFFKFTLFCEVLLVMGSLVAKDFWGALSLYFVVLLGLCCLPGERGINVTRCLYYAVMVIYCGVLNTIQSVIFFRKSEYICCFHDQTPVPIQVTQLVRIALPPVQMMSAFVSWSMFKDCARTLEQIPLVAGDMAAARRLGNNQGYYDFDNAGAGNRGDQGARQSGRGLPLPGGDRQFQAFQGTGHKLGG